jgi:hypothetical protein
MMKRRECEYLAMLMAAYCLRDAVVRPRLVGDQIVDSEKMVFNKAAMNRLFTFLTFHFGETDEASKMAFLNLMARYYPDGWGLPELDKDMVAEVKEAIKKGSRLTPMS